MFNFLCRLGYWHSIKITLWVDVVSDYEAVYYLHGMSHGDGIFSMMFICSLPFGAAHRSCWLFLCKLVGVSGESSYMCRDCCVQMLHVASLAASSVDKAPHQMSSGIWRRDCWCRHSYRLCCGTPGWPSARCACDSRGDWWLRWSHQWVYIGGRLHTRRSSHYMLSTVAMALASAQWRNTLCSMVSEQTRITQQSGHMLPSISLELSASPR